ncbi:MAG: PKD domain-containing protein [Patescibacteria group bacterium]
MRNNIFSAVILTALVASIALSPAGASAQTKKNRPPVINGISSPTVLNVDAEGTWTIKAYDPENSSLSYSVDWGDEENNFRTTMLGRKAEFSQSASFSHSYADAGTYNVKFAVKDDSGATAKSSVTVRVGKKSSSSLKISDVSATSTKPNRATVTWNTDIKSNSVLWLSTKPSIDTSKKPSIYRPEHRTKHKIELTRLNPDTTYYVVVKSSTKKNSAISSEFSFKTPPLANLAPVIKSIDGPKSLEVEQEGTWTLNAYDPKNSPLSYSVDWGDEGVSVMARFFTKEDPFVQTSTFTHSYAEAGTYAIKFTAKNEAGKTTESTVKVEVTKATDTVAPVLSAITTQSVGSDQATITWNTDEASDSAIYYSTTSPVILDDEDTASVTDSSLVTSHSLSATDLVASTTYHFLVQSKDSAGNAATSSEFSLTTTGI